MTQDIIAEAANLRVGLDTLVPKALIDRLEAMLLGQAALVRAVQRLRDKSLKTGVGFPPAEVASVLETFDDVKAHELIDWIDDERAAELPKMLAQAREVIPELLRLLEVRADELASEKSRTVEAQQARKDVIETAVQTIGSNMCERHREEISRETFDEFLAKHNAEGCPRCNHETLALPYPCDCPRPGLHWGAQCCAAKGSQDAPVEECGCHCHRTGPPLVEQLRMCRADLELRTAERNQAWESIEQLEQQPRMDESLLLEVDRVLEQSLGAAQVLAAQIGGGQIAAHYGLIAFVAAETRINALRGQVRSMRRGERSEQPWKQT